MTSLLGTYWLVAIVLTCSSTSAVNFLHSNKMKLLNKVEKLETCAGEANLSHEFKDIHVEMDPETETLYVTAVLNATAPIEEGTKGHVKIYRCLTDDERSCTKSLEIDIEDFCSHLPEMNKLWSPIVGSLENFDPNCPVPPGVYALHDAPLETRSLENKYALVGHWQVKVVVENQGRVMACLLGDATISIDNAAGRG